MNRLSDISFIDFETDDPVKFFLHVMEAHKAGNQPRNPINLNMATIDPEFGALNRTVNYRGLTKDNHIRIVTQTDSRKYANIMSDPRTTITFYFEVPFNSEGDVSQWQVRLFGKAVLLSPEEISNLWSEETVFAKIRSRICDCGKPIDFSKLKEAHDKYLRAYESGEDSLPQTKLFTAFKIVPTIWDFYKSDPNCIGDRIQYRKSESGEDTWTKMHVAA